MTTPEGRINELQASSLRVDGVEIRADNVASVLLASQAVFKTLVSNEACLRVLMPGVNDVLRSAGITCVGCPVVADTLASGPLRIVDLLPYLVLTFQPEFDKRGELKLVRKAVADVWPADVPFDLDIAIAATLLLGSNRDAHRAAREKFEWAMKTPAFKNTKKGEQQQRLAVVAAYLVDVLPEDPTFLQAIGKRAEALPELGLQLGSSQSPED